MISNPAPPPPQQQGWFPSLKGSAQKFSHPVLQTPDKLTWIIIIANGIILLSALFLPLLSDTNLIKSWCMEWELWTAETTPDPATRQSVIVSATWLIAVDLTSIVSLALVNFKSSNQKIRSIYLRKLDVLKDANRAASKVNIKITAVWIFTGGVMVVLFFLIANLWIKGPKEGMIFWAALISGLGYMSIVTISDFIGSSALEDCQEVENKVNALCADGEIKTELLSTLKETENDLLFFRRVILFVDAPILLGLALISLQEHFVLYGSPYSHGFATGAIAMHIVIGNLVSIVLATYRFNK